MMSYEAQDIDSRDQSGPKDALDESLGPQPPRTRYPRQEPRYRVCRSCNILHIIGGPCPPPHIYSSVFHFKKQITRRWKAKRKRSIHPPNSWTRLCLLPGRKSMMQSMSSLSPIRFILGPAFDASVGSHPSVNRIAPFGR